MKRKAKRKPCAKCAEMERDRDLWLRLIVRSTRKLLADKEAQAKCKLEALLSAYSNAFVAARAVLRHELANGTTEVNGRRWLTAEALERVIRAMEG